MVPSQNSDCRELCGPRVGSLGDKLSAVPALAVEARPQLPPSAPRPSRCRSFLTRSLAACGRRLCRCWKIKCHLVKLLRPRPLRSHAPGAPAPCQQHPGIVCPRCGPTGASVQPRPVQGVAQEEAAAGQSCSLAGTAGSEPDLVGFTAWAFSTPVDSQASSTHDSVSVCCYPGVIRRPGVFTPGVHAPCALCFDILCLLFAVAGFHNPDAVNSFHLGASEHREPQCWGLLPTSARLLLGTLPTPACQ